jgi:hypothetical protein
MEARLELSSCFRPFVAERGAGNKSRMVSGCCGHLWVSMGKRLADGCTNIGGLEMLIIAVVSL